MFIYIYIYMYICKYIYIYIYLGGLTFIRVSFDVEFTTLIKST